jgi:hypothetical protein
MSGTKRSLAASKPNAFRFPTASFSKPQARHEIFEYIEIYYNNQRLHSALDYHTPHQYESAWNAETNTFSKQKIIKEHKLNSSVVSASD